MARIGLTDTGKSAVVKLCDGNPGAITVMCNMLAQGAAIDPDSAFGGLGVLLAMDAEEIYGSRVWMLFKDVCGQDLNKTLALLRAVQLGILMRSKLHHAIDNYGEGVDVDATCEAVKERLPRFQLVA